MCPLTAFTWLMHSTGVLNSWLRRWSVDATVSICLVLSIQSAAWNSHLNRAASESTTRRRTAPRARRRGTRLERHTWRESCKGTEEGNGVSLYEAWANYGQFSQTKLLKNYDNGKGMCHTHQVSSVLHVDVVAAV